MRRQAQTTANTEYVMPVEANDPNERGVGGFVITKVVRQHVPITQGKNGDYTFGQILDQQLESAALAGDEIREVTLEINEDVWQETIRRAQGYPVTY